MSRPGSPSEEGSASLPASGLWGLCLRRLDSSDGTQGVKGLALLLSHLLVRSPLLVSPLSSAAVEDQRLSIIHSQLSGAHFKVRAAGHLGLRVAEGEDPHFWVQ